MTDRPGEIVRTMTPWELEVLADHMGSFFSSLLKEDLRPSELIRDMVENMPYHVACELPTFGTDLRIGLSPESRQRWEEALRDMIALAIDHGGWPSPSALLEWRFRPFDRG